MKEQEINSVLYELYKITGFRMSLHDVNFAEIAAYPPQRLPVCELIHKCGGEYERCRESDGEAFRRVQERHETVIYKCRYGLIEAVSPLYNFGILTGYLMMGQVIESGDGEAKLRAALDGLAAKEETDEAVGRVRKVPPDMVQSYVKIMTICAQYLTLSNAVPREKPSVPELAKIYINDNLDKKITIHDICRAVGCSKTTLMTAFKREFGTTVNAAITDMKLEEAKKLLAAGKLSINEIAHVTGFYDQSYFSKVFSARYGIPPSEYRKETL